jgi:hypothetical protein
VLAVAVTTRFGLKALRRAHGARLKSGSIVIVTDCGSLSPTAFVARIVNVSVPVASRVRGVVDTAEGGEVAQRALGRGGVGVGLRIVLRAEAGELQLHGLAGAHGAVIGPWMHAGRSGAFTSTR